MQYYDKYSRSHEMAICLYVTASVKRDELLIKRRKISQSREDARLMPRFFQTFVVTIPEKQQSTSVIVMVADVLDPNRWQTISNHCAHTAVNLVPNRSHCTTRISHCGPPPGNTSRNNDETIPLHDGVIKWKQFPLYWPFVRGIHRSSLNSPHKGQWRGDLMFSLICAWTNGRVNNRGVGYLRCHRAHHDLTVMEEHFSFNLHHSFVRYLADISALPLLLMSISKWTTLPMLLTLCARNSPVTGDFRRPRAQYNVTVMYVQRILVGSNMLVSLFLTRQGFHGDKVLGFTCLSCLVKIISMHHLHL